MQLKLKFLLAILTTPVVVTMTIATGAAYAQEPIPGNFQDTVEDFRLFESVESADQAAQPRGRTSRQSRNASAEPEFTLVGTSRIGNRLSAILRNKDGSEVMVASSPDNNTVIDGYSQYAIVDISSGRVAIQYPGNSPCVAYENQGVSCNSAANIASLELAQGAPLQQAAGAGRSPEAIEDEGEVIVSEEREEPTNPFAALRARAEAAGSTNPAGAPGTSPRRNFTPRRIDPADVPPGMRVVSTPFGDRLVEE